MNADLHCSDLASHHFRYLLVLHFLITAEDQHFALFCRQFEHRAFEQCDLLLMFECAAWGRRGTLKTCRVILGQHCFRVMFSVIVDARVASDVKHPGLESAVFPKRGAILENAKENILNEILRDGPAARHPGKKIEQSTVMPVEKRTELGDVAGSHGPHQVFVGFNHSVCRNYSFLKRLHESEREQSKVGLRDRRMNHGGRSNRGTDTEICPVILVSVPESSSIAPAPYQKRCR